MTQISIFWFRRDLRLSDNAGLYRALVNNKDVQPIFIFDRNILDHLTNKNDARVHFIHNALQDLSEALSANGATLKTYYGKPIDIWKELLKTHQIKSVYSNRDYEPYGNARDSEVAELLQANGIEFKQYKDQVIFEKSEVTKDDGLPYTVFTPYKRKWLKALKQEPEAWAKSYYFKSYPTEKYFNNFHKSNDGNLIPLSEMGFAPSDIDFPPKEVNQSIIKKYGEQRNFPAINGTSKLGVHFRFGTISIREKARKAVGLCETYLSELVWRDFYAQILHHFPHVVHDAFRAKYDRIEWLEDEKTFELWCAGQTGYPMVDAGMRELNATGYMHNRVRMVVASFLTKHLLTDWRKGEAYFAEKLLDFDLASNNGGWQWASGSGTDAAPYFRIFNPTSQLTKFDKQLQYVKKWVPEYGTDAYTAPIVDHKMARERCLDTYKRGIN